MDPPHHGLPPCLNIPIPTIQGTSPFLTRVPPTIRFPISTKFGAVLESSMSKNNKYMFLQ